MHQALEQLDERSRDILAQRWLNDKKATLHDLAAQYQVSAERIRQLEKNAMLKDPRSNQRSKSIYLGESMKKIRGHDWPFTLELSLFTSAFAAASDKNASLFFPFPTATNSKNCS